MFTNQKLIRPTFAYARRISPTYFHSSIVRRSGQILECNNSTFNKMVIEAKEPVIVDFYADWCGPCKALTPILEQVVKENKKINLVKLNTDDNPDLAKKYKITSLPTVHAFHNGKSINHFIGVKPPGEIKAFVENAASLANE
ncbi:16386_t:CDS:2 [Funneliformis geosporum]|uniref:15967_t:CDS:1 n=1 Tax=Funneliformis geosporum TaxID=1117311 RepID=A0A9W4WSY7_9GLOM|nr:16386_t:CDS:2 [Funneliformis geosporum]CAI2183703.1 15967_t:CDS:2 [Funneliformis geosporum]